MRDVISNIVWGIVAVLVILAVATQFVPLDTLLQVLLAGAAVLLGMRVAASTSDRRDAVLLVVVVVLAVGYLFVSRMFS